MTAVGTADLQHGPGELDTRIHRNNTGLRGFVNRAPPTAREGITSRDESVIVPLDALEVQSDQIAHRQPPICRLSPTTAM